MNQTRQQQINYIKKWAFVKYQLNGYKSMNTYIFTHAKKANLTIEEIENLIDDLSKQIDKYEAKRAKEHEEETAKELEKITIKGL